MYVCFECAKQYCHIFTICHLTKGDTAVVGFAFCFGLQPFFMDFMQHEVNLHNKNYYYMVFHVTVSNTSFKGSLSLSQ